MIDKATSQEISHEVILSEKHRITVMLIIFSLLMCIMGVGTFLVNGLKLFSVNFPVRDLFLIFIIISIYFAAGRFVLSVLIKKGKTLPSFARYVNLFIEMSIPTAGILVISQTNSAHDALTSPPLLAYGIFIFLSAMRMNKVMISVASIFAATQYLLITFYLLGFPGSPDANYLDQSFVFYISRAGFILISGLATWFVTHQLTGRMMNVIETVEEKNSIVGIFGQHVSPDVVATILQDNKKELQTRNLNLTVMFLDIRNFTSFSEKRSPDEVVDFLNTMFDFMIQIISENGGIINKFLGDGFMAVFGAPIECDDHAQKSLTASVAIVNTLEEKIKTNDLPECRIGIGLHSGTALTGSIGSETRKEYTIIGDVVNLASRVESLNKKHGSSLLITDAVMENIKAEDLAIPKPESMGQEMVKGRVQPVEIYRVI